MPFPSRVSVISQPHMCNFQPQREEETILSGTCCASKVSRPRFFHPISSVECPTFSSICYGSADFSNSWSELRRRCFVQRVLPAMETTWRRLLRASNTWWRCCQSCPGTACWLEIDTCSFLIWYVSLSNPIMSRGSRGPENAPC